MLWTKKPLSWVVLGMKMHAEGRRSFLQLPSKFASGDVICTLVS